MNIPNCSKLKDLEKTILDFVNSPPMSSNNDKKREGIYKKFLQRSQSSRKKLVHEDENYLHSVINNKSVLNNETEKCSLGARNGTICDPTVPGNTPSPQCTKNLLNTTYGSSPSSGRPANFQRTSETTTVCTESEAATFYLYSLIDGLVLNELEELMTYEVGETIYYLKKYEDSLTSEITRRENLKAILHQKKQKTLLEDTSIETTILPGGGTKSGASTSDQCDSGVSQSSLHTAVPEFVFPSFLMKDWTVVQGVDPDDIRVSGDILDVKDQSLVEKSHTSSRVISTPATNVIKTNCCVYYLIGKFKFPYFNESQKTEQQRKLSPLKRQNNISNDQFDKMSIKSQEMNLKKNTEVNHTSPSKSQEDLRETETPLSPKRKKWKRRSDERKLK